MWDIPRQEICCMEFWVMCVPVAVQRCFPLWNLGKPFLVWEGGLAGSVLRFWFCLCCSLWFEVSVCCHSLLCADQSLSDRQLVGIVFPGAEESRREEEKGSSGSKHSSFFLSSATAVEDSFSWQIVQILEDVISFPTLSFLVIPLWLTSGMMPGRRWLYFLLVSPLSLGILGFTALWLVLFFLNGWNPKSR